MREGKSTGGRAGQYATGWSHWAHLFCEMEEKRLQTSTKERSSELQEKGDGKNATWSGKESAKRQKCIKWSTASINIGGTRIVGGT